MKLRTKLTLFMLMEMLILTLLLKDNFSDPGDTALGSSMYESEVDLTIPKYVALQISSGKINCDFSDPLTNEACLLFQGALGVWHRLGEPYNCPAIVGKKFRSNSTIPSKLPSKLITEDVVKAQRSPCFGYLYAIGVANLVPVLVSTANRTFQLQGIKGFEEPGSNPDLCISARHGICGNQAAVGNALFERAGYLSRSVEFYYTEAGQRFSHIIPEVLIDADWFPVDTTYGAYWISSVPGSPFKLVSTKELIAQRFPVRVIWNQALLPHGLYLSILNTNPLNYITSDADIIRGGKGAIRLNIMSDAGKELFSDIPNFIGDNLLDGQTEGLEFNFIGKPTRYHFKIRVTGSALNENSNAQICLNKSCQDFTKNKSEYEFNVFNPVKLYFKSNQDSSYLVLDSIEWSLLKK